MAAFAALALGAAVAASLLPAGDAARDSASLASASVASPAEGHSPRLLHELSGPLDKTGLARPGSSVRVAAPMQQATAAAASTALNGVDVSSAQHVNGAPINWAQVAGAGYDFAAIKATEGNYYVNPYYASDAAAAVAAGMYVMAYHFANPPKSSGAVQADYAWQHAGKYTVGGHYLPLMLDLEYDPYSTNECYGMSPSAMVSWISSFVTEATILTGAAPVIYTPTNWWDACTANSTAFTSDLLSVPAYAAGTPGVLPGGWSTWAMWQYTSSGTVPGISGTMTDLDYFSGGPELEQSNLNAPVSIQIQTLNALAGQQVTYSPSSATGLPPGVTLSSTGQITGTPSAVGTYQVTVTPSGSGPVLPATVSFTWNVSAVAAAVVGTNGAPYAQAPQLPPGWHSLGGNVIAPPAVVAAPNPNGTSPAAPLYIGTGVNNGLYLHTSSLASNWQRLGPQEASCLGSAAAVIVGSTLTVACEGENHALYYNSAPMPSSGLPQFTNKWQGLGGTISAGPAVAPVGGVLTFFVRGTNGHIYSRTQTAANYTAAPWACLGQPAAALQAATGVTVFACEGNNHVLYEATNSGSGWSATIALGGALLAGPAVAATSLAPLMLAELGGQGVWERTNTGGWSSLGGTVVGGVQAAALN